MPRFGVQDFDYSLQFVGGSSTDYATVAHNSSLDFSSATSFTVEAWVFPDRSMATNGDIVSKWSATVGQRTFLLFKNNLDQIRFGARTSAGSENFTPITSNTLLHFLEWNHCVGVWNGSTLECWVNTVSSGTQAHSGTPNASSSTPMQIGIFSGATLRSWGGNMALVRVYKNIAWTLPDVKNAYYEGSVKRSGLVGEYLFTEGADATLTDTSGQGNSMTINGATWSSKVPFDPRVTISTNRSGISVARSTISTARTAVT